MRDELFSYLVEFGHKLCYYHSYKISARRISNIYTGFLMLVSAGGIVTLSCWDAVPVLWALITALAQILQVLKPLMQSARQQDALRYIVQDFDALFDDMCAYWNTVGAYVTGSEKDDEIAAKLAEWKEISRTTFQRFAPKIDFPFKKRLDKRATLENQRYFWYHYDVRPKEVMTDVHK